MKRTMWLFALLCLLLCAVFANAASADGISQDAAWQIAWTDAGADSQTAKTLYCNPDSENGQAVFELSFVFENAEYEYTLRTADGAILEKEKELLTVDTASASDALIAENQASRIALESAGQTESDVTFSKIKLEREHGLWVYEITFRSADNVEYQYEILASSGLILKEGYEAWDKTPDEPQPAAKETEQKKSSQKSSSSTKKSSSSSSGSKAAISLNDAKSIALKHAGVSSSKVKFSKAKLTRDDGRLIYDIEFYIRGKAEYEYEIDANTGKILDADIDDWDDD